MFLLCSQVGFWSLICVGLFAHEDPTREALLKRNGLLRGGNYELLAAQTLYGVVCCVWAAFSTYVIMKASKLTKEDENKIQSN